MEEAEQILNSEQNQINSFYFQILKLDLFWWKYSLSRTKTDAQIFKEVLTNFATIPENNQKEKINELIRSSYQMRFEIKRNNFIGALRIRYLVRKQIESIKSEKIILNNEEQKIFDLYVILFQYFENVINPLSLKSKSQKLSNSLLLLEKHALEDEFISATLAHYFLGRTYIKVENNFEKGAVHFRILERQFPKNKLFRDIANGTNTKF